MMLTSNAKLSSKPSTKLGLAMAIAVFWVAAIVASPALAQSAPSWTQYSHQDNRCGTDYGRSCADSN
jgi:hypothetical protein